MKLTYGLDMVLGFILVKAPELTIMEAINNFLFLIIERDLFIKECNCVQHSGITEDPRKGSKSNNISPAPRTDVSKVAASAFTWKLKLKGCRYKKKVKRALIT